MKRDKSKFSSFHMNKKIIYLAGGVTAVSIVTASMVWISQSTGTQETVTYREATVEYGNLTVGITEDSSVSIGTLTQSFDLDISALVSNSSISTSSAASNYGGNTFGFGSMMGLTGNNSVYSSQSQEMEIEAVHITVGQEIQEGDVLYTLTEDSVNEIRTQLEQDIQDTYAEYEALEVEQQESRLTARQGYDTYVMNGKLAQLEYQLTVEELEEVVANAENTTNELQEQLNENLVKLLDLQQELVGAQKDLTDARAAVTENYEYRFTDAYYYTVYKNTRDMAKEIVESLEEDIESLTEENESLEKEIAEALRSYNQACRDLEKGKLEAQQTLDTDVYYASAAAEWYAIQTASLDNEMASLYTSYESAVEKLEDFDDYIVGTDLLAQYNGVVTEVPLVAGDSVTKAASLVTMYDQEEVTMDIIVSEDDYESINQEGSINIFYDAYPDVMYTAVISEISDAEYDSSTATVYYTITVTVQGDVNGLYEGMTGEVTFVTKETKEVTYVSNRAILRDGTRSYVKMHDESGKVVERDVVTGFSDGINVEIVEGLSEGDAVLIESKVSES